ncbi:ATP-grasp domain-containing protein [Flavobacterium sp. LS1P28]|uniref:ATP-grasp domain-containing protein n=1 Tax=unclassified Flavobacterium TaxID=196869 RepID=UPI000F83DC92|nr:MULTISPECIES: ATP-grasp domain-containing protein [unclassified Flavobacterium]RTY81458.1 ATP-grasp domain-containing protein [Flavobacterium sp. LS1P28]RTZ08732.1 ATP-grasp domain-containing protein [Flavobacterium sp. GSP6]
MFLIDKPFVSDFLIKTIKDNNYKIIATKVAKELVKDDSLSWIAEEEAITLLKNNPEISLYSNSENALAWIDQYYGESELSSQLHVLKNKVKFRELIKELFPDFYFKQISIEEIQRLSDDEIRFPFVIKPAVGFFSIGVHIVENEKDWVKAKSELQPDKLKSIFPENVLNTSNFIIEEFIRGEEYAIDYYYDNNGDAVLLNVLHHLFSSGTDTSDRVYSTSKAIIEKYKIDLEYFLSKIGKELHLKNFPAHAEVRIDENGKIIPIEVNPLRFGGFCTTADLLGVTLGFNEYKCFCENKKPDWNTIFKGKENKTFSVIILDNNSGIIPSDILGFNYSGLAKDFEKPIVIRELDINKYPVFGFAFIESAASNKKELNDILTSDLRKYIVSK